MRYLLLCFSLFLLACGSPTGFTGAGTNEISNAETFPNPVQHPDGSLPQTGNPSDDTLQAPSGLYCGTIYLRSSQFANSEDGLKLDVVNPNGNKTTYALFTRDQRIQSIFGRIGPGECLEACVVTSKGPQQGFEGIYLDVEELLVSDD